MVSIRSCIGVIIKKVQGKVSMPAYFMMFAAFFSGIFFDMLTKKTALLIE